MKPACRFSDAPGRYPLRFAFPVIVVFLLLTMLPCATAQSEIGRVESISGTVSIDAFGADSFISAESGDLLYDTSVIRTSFESSAQVLLDGDLYTIPSEAEVRIGELRESQQKKRRSGWFASLIGAIRAVVVGNEQQTATLGGRAAEASQNENTWVLDEEDDDALFEQAKSYLAEERYLEAIDKLDQILFLPLAAFPGEIDFLRGHANYLLGLFSSAAESFSISLEKIGDTGSVESEIPFNVPLRFEYGSSLYLMGETAAATKVLEPVSAQYDNELAPFVLVVYARSLAESGDRDAARRVAEEGLKRYADTELSGEYQSIITEAE